ncbi:MAG TPA: hypothetical protein PKY50_06075 [Candidatus Competibacter sp.]|nr:hypothetical protein [Candidatus Competibacter sp.]
MTTKKLTRGIRNNNPGNIDRQPGVRWQGQSADQSGDSRFVVFDAPKWGIRAIARVLITYQDKRRAKDGSKIDTIREIVDRWAPPVENDTGAYAEHVAKLTQIGIDDTLDVYDYATLRALVAAIITHENGFNPYDADTLDAGLKLAGIEPPRKPIVKQPDVIATAGAGIGALGLAATELMQNHLGEAISAAQQVSAIEPDWIKPAFLLLVVALIGAAVVKQIREHRKP